MSSELVKYQHEVFISYSHIGPVGTWIRCFFLKELTQWLSVELGGELDIFWDEGVEPGDYWKTTILEALLSSKVIVPLWTKGYFKSHWCRAELRSFYLREERSQCDLVIPIRWHGDDDSDCDPDSKRKKAADFRPYAITAAAFSGTPTYVEFEEAVKKLCAVVGKRISSAPDFSKDWPVVDPNTSQVMADPHEWTARTVTLVRPRAATA